MRGRLSPQQAARWAEIKEAFGRVQRMGGGDADPVARVTGTLSGLDLQLKGIREAITGAFNAANGKSAAPELSALAKNLAELGRPRIEVRLEDEREGGLFELFGQQTALLTQALGALAKRGPDNGAATEQKLSELSTLLGRIAKQIELGVGSARRVDVQLEPSGASNLYRTLSGEDLFDSGGIFVATYEKPPPLGADVRVSVRFPAGSSCELSGNVAWVRDQLGEDAPPGFGVRFGAVTSEARQLVQAYCAAREPMLHDD
jgi:Tfp pilus assembly protein PilZ